MVCLLAVVPLEASEPFDYFVNSWNVIALKDYTDGTRVTSENELQLAGKSRCRLVFGPGLAPLGRQAVKTLMDGWLPVIRLATEQAGVVYDVTLWATPLPSVTNWPAAFDWPTEGENFLNWVRICATNRGSSRAVARAHMEQVSPQPVTLARWSQELDPGGGATGCFRVPFRRLAGDGVFDGEDAALWLKRTAEYWRGVLAQGARIEVPCAKSTEALKAAHVCQLIASDHGSLHAGEGFYDEFYIRDGGYQMLELEEAGLWEPARQGLASYLRAQRPDGRFESQKDQLDANGQALWTLWQYWKITGNRDWLRSAFPQMRRAAEWIRKTRRQAPYGAPCHGLLPAAPADGEYLWDGKHHIVGYDFWNLRGLLCVADVARALGETAEAQAWDAEANAYRQAMDAAWGRTGLRHFPPSWEKAGTHWGNTETLWPTELFAPDDPRVDATIAELRHRHGGGFAEGTLRWTGHPNVIHPYLSSYTTMASLLRGDHDAFVEDYHWYLLHSSASHAFPEGIHFKRRHAWSDTLPHVLGAANFAFLLRHALLHERGDELHLLPGVPDDWLGEGREIHVDRAPTHFGVLSLHTRGRPGGIELRLDGPDRHRPHRVVVHLPKSRPALDAPGGVEVMVRNDQGRPWDMARVVEAYRALPVPQAKQIRGLVSWPLPQPVDAARCQMLDLAAWANTDPFHAPFGVERPGRYLFAGLRTGVQTVAGVPFRMVDAGTNSGRGLIVLHGAGASGTFPRDVTVPVGAQGRRLFLLGNVHGWAPDDEGADEWGALAEYVIHYADGQTQRVPLVSHRTTDDWASPPDATDVVAGCQGDPWHLNVLGVSLRPCPVEKILFRDLGTPAAPVLVAVTLER